MDSVSDAPPQSPIEVFASRLKAASDELIRIFEPADTRIVVAGGETQGT